MKKEVLFRKAFLLLFERLALAFSFVLNNKTRKTTAQAFSTWGLGAARYSTGKPALASGILLLLFSVGVQQSVFGQISEGFETGLRTSGYAGNGTNSGTLTLSSGTWTFVNSGLRSTNFNTGAYSCQMQSGASNSATLPALNTCGTITLWFRGGIPTLSKTVSGVTTSVTLTDTGITNNSFKKYTANVNDASSAVILTIFNSTATSYLDDVSTTAYSGLTPPTLTAAANATVDAPFDVTFTEDATWRNAITSISVGGTTLTAGYTVSAGKITFTPSASTLLQSAGSKSIIVFAAGYYNATVTQTIGAGAASKLSMNTQPTAPTANGGALATQPKVNILDQYGNATTSTASITAAVGAGTWGLGGTPTVSASAGVATFTNLTATSAAPVTGATITFSSSGLTGVTSATFNIPGSPPTLTAAANATVDAPFDVTFTDDATWRAAISSITVGGTTLATNAYTVSTGKITFTPSASILLQTAGAKNIVVSATGYGQASVIQQLGVGVPVKLVISIQPTAPASNGAVLAVQPKVNVTDQYGNVVTTSTATVTATVGAGGWVLGGTLTVSASAGLATFTNLTATSVAALTGATITFTSPGLSPETSTNFSIGAPTTTAPVATAATNVNATSFTANWNAMPGATSYVIDVYTKTVQSNQTIAAWTFPNTTDDNSIDEYNINNSGKTITGQGFSTTNPPTVNYTQITNPLSTTSVVSSTGWDGGSGSKFWQIDINTTGASQMKLSSVQRSSNTGPRDFKVQYKVGVGAWTDVTGATLTVANNWTSGVLTDVALPSACDNQSSVLIRWIMTSNTGVNGSAVGSGGTSAIDNIYIKGDFIANSYLVQNSNVGNVTSFTVTGLNPVSTYYYVVRAVNGAVVSPNSNEIQVITRPDTTIWDGNTWSNGAPALDINAVVNGALSMSTSLEAKSITVNSGGSVIVTTGKTLRVANEVNNATNDATKFIVESGASLIQNNAAANVGPITVKRNSYPLYLQDYTLWASPVANQNLRNFSPNTLYNRFYSYDTTIATNGNWVQEIVTTADMNTKTFGLAKGYLIRMPNNWTAFSNLQTPGTVYPGVFVGVPNSGTITYTLSNANTGYNLVGNPYPSPISVASFRAANPGIGGTLYFYRKRNAAVGSGYGTLSQAGFAGNVSVNNFGLIEVGQGFFVKANGVSTLNFTNGMRAEASANAVFLRSSSAANTALTNDNPVEMNRFWLNLVKDNEQVGQALIGYIEGTTLGVDEDFDAKYFNDSALALTSIINNQEYIIQARPVPFVATDVVPLGFKTDVAGTYTFALGNKEGLFADATQNPIYLKDNTTNTLHHLNSGVYTFNSAAGVFNTRFEIWYEDNTLGNPSFGVDHNVNVYKQNKTIVVDAGTTRLEKIEIWDTLGRLLFTTTTSDTRFEVKQPLMENQVLLIKITTEKGSSNKKMHY